MQWHDRRVGRRRRWRLPALILPAVAVAMAVSGCYWQPSSEATGSVTVRAQELASGPAEFRVRFYAGDRLAERIDRQPFSIFDGEVTFEDVFEVGYPGGLPRAAEIARRTQYDFTLRGSSGQLNISGIPADTPFQVLVERIGSDEHRMAFFVDGSYAADERLLSHIGFSRRAFTVGVGESVVVPIELEYASLASLDVDPDTSRLEGVEFGSFYFDLLSAEEGEFVLPLNTDGTLVSGSRFYGIAYPAAELVRPSADDPFREELETQSVVEGVLPGRRMQLLLAANGQSAQDRSLAEYETGIAYIGVSRPFTLNPGEQRSVTVPIYPMS